MPKKIKTERFLDASARYDYLLRPVSLDTSRAMSGAPKWAKFSENISADMGQDQFKARIFEVLQGKNLEMLPKESKNWSQVRVGRMIGIAYSHSRKKSKSKIRYWVVRCDCGEYEMRTHESLSKNTGDNMCLHCRQAEDLKKAALFENRHKLKKLKI